MSAVDASGSDAESGAFAFTQRQIADAKQKADEETLDQQSLLTQSKDRAQITASTAMSIINVALLKAVLDQGPVVNKYFFLEIILLAVALALQIISGILGFMVTNMMSYADKYGENFCEDCRENLCSCICIAKSELEGTRVRRTEGPANEIRIGEDGKMTFIPISEGWPWEHGTLSTRPRDPCPCCPCTCTAEVYEPHEYRALNRLEHWYQGHIDRELLTVKAEEELSHQVNIMEQANAQLAELEAKLAKGGENEADLNAQIQQLQDLLAVARDRKETFEATLRKARIAREQGKLMAGYVKTIRQNRVLKMVSFWQNIINYIFYVVFVVNAFITGFGLAGSASSAETSGSFSNSSKT